MARRCWAFLLCVGLLPGAYAIADGGSDELTALLSRADVAARGFRGEFEIFGGDAQPVFGDNDQPDAPLDYRTDDLRWKARGWLWVKGDDALVEFLGYPRSTPSGWGSRYKDIIQVLAASKDGTFKFTALAPHRATLETYTPDQPEWVRNRIDSQILGPLNAFSTINGFSIKSILTSGEAVVRADPAKGQYSITAKHNDARNSSTSIYDLTITGQSVNCWSKLTTGPPDSAIIIETLAEGDIQSGTLVPRRVAKRISAPAWGDMGPGWRDVTREVVYFTPKDLDPASFPITSGFFKKYEMPYSVVQGGAGQSRWFNSAKRLTVLAIGGLLAAFGLILWFRSLGSRSTAKKSERPFPDLL